MAVLLVASSQPRVGRSMIAAAAACRRGRDGAPVTLARAAGDDSADANAQTFASFEELRSPGKPLSIDELKALASAGDVIVEAPPGDVSTMAKALSARVLEVRGTATAAVAGAAAIITGVPAVEVSRLSGEQGVLAVLAEDRTLAAPSVTDIAAVLKAKWLVESAEHGAIGRVMIGTVASDAASPYFEARDRKCVVTRYDKTDIQLAALLTDMELLVLTGGGQPSPYLLDRVAGTRDDVSVLLAEANTVDAMRSIEGLFGRGRFEGRSKLERAVELLDEAGFSLD